MVCSKYFISDKNYDTQNSVYLISWSMNYNKSTLIHIHRHTDHFLWYSLWENSQLGFFSSCFVWPSFQNVPLMTMHIIIRAGSPWVDWGLPGCKQWFMAQGSVKEQLRPTLKPFTRQGEQGLFGNWHESKVCPKDWTLQRHGRPSKAKEEWSVWVCVLVQCTKIRTTVHISLTKWGRSCWSLKHHRDVWGLKFAGRVRL